MYDCVLTVDFITDKGKDEPRKAVSGRELPNARHIRTTLFKDMNKPAPKHNLYVMQFGQMVAHDTELTISKTSSEYLPASSGAEQPLV